MILCCEYESPIGRMLLAQEGEALVGCWFFGQKYFPKNAESFLREETALLRTARLWLDGYFRGESPDPRALPLGPKGSDFRREVWDILLTIPAGQTMTYAEIARLLAAKRSIPRMSAQAVGGAVGHNPISIIIPCHRVVGTDGSLTGYAGGMEKKEALLALEQAVKA